MSSRKKISDLSRAFGQAVRALRLQAGFTQEGFAHACGVDRGYMGVIERGGTNPTVSTIWKIASTLNKRPRDVIAEVEKNLTRLKDSKSHSDVRKRPQRLSKPAPRKNEQAQK